MNNRCIPEKNIIYYFYLNYKTSKFTFQFDIDGLEKLSENATYFIYLQFKKMKIKAKRFSLCATSPIDIHS